jgi:peroxiredoxin
MRKAILFLLVTLLTLFGLKIPASADTGKAKASDATQARIDQKAPDFKLTDSSGKTHSLSDFKGRYVVLEWINYDCPFVLKHYRSGNMQKLQREYTKKGVVWLTICSSAKGKQGYFSAKEIGEYSKKHKAMHTAYLVDSEGTVGRMYGAKTTPHMYVINPKGVLIYTGGIDDKRSTKTADVKGAMNYVSTSLDEAMRGKPVTVKSAAPYGCAVKYKDS